MRPLFTGLSPIKHHLKNGGEVVAINRSIMSISTSYHKQTDIKPALMNKAAERVIEPKLRPVSAAPVELERSFLRRFEDSMVMNFDKWHDGVGYDLDALRAMEPDEKCLIEAMLLRRGARDWRDIEALACIDTPQARAAIQGAMNSPNPEVRNAVTRCAPELIPAATRAASLVQGLETANFFGGLTETLEQVATFHPPLIVDALLRGALWRSGELAVHFCAMLCYIHGEAATPFDLAQRSFFIRFDTDNRAKREVVFSELCDKIGVDAARYLPKGKFAAAASVLAGSLQ